MTRETRREPAKTRQPVMELIARRWSPKAFGPEVPSGNELASMFEAGRWAPSCFNNQPWRYLVTTRNDPGAFSRALACLTEKNASWVRNAPLLAFQVMRETFEYNGKPNPWSGFDCGLAMAQLIIQAEFMGWSVHVMAGFSRDRVRETFGVPEGFKPLVAFVIGREGDPHSLPPHFMEEETAPRERKELEETVFSDSWGKSLF